MNKGKIRSCDTINNLRNNLEKYDSFTIKCETLKAKTIERLKLEENIIECNFKNNELKIITDKLEKTIDLTTRALRKENIQIESINTTEYSLEDIFIKVTTEEEKI